MRRHRHHGAAAVVDGISSWWWWIGLRGAARGRARWSSGDCESCGARRCELATTRSGTAAPLAPVDFLLCRAVDVQMERDSSGESLAGFLLVMMTTASEDVVLPVGGVILEPIPSVRVSPGESPVHLLDKRWWRLWRRYLLEGVVGGDTSRPGGGRPLVAWRDGVTP